MNFCFDPLAGLRAGEEGEWRVESGEGGCGDVVEGIKG